MCIQFFRPRATGRIEFSARLLLSSKFGVFQEAREFLPQRERVLAGLAECTGGQCNGLCCFDLATDIVQRGLGSFLTQEHGAPCSPFLCGELLRRRQTVRPSAPPSELQPGLVDLAAPPRKTVFSHEPNKRHVPFLARRSGHRPYSRQFENAFELSQESFGFIAPAA